MDKGDKVKRKNWLNKGEIWEFIRFSKINSITRTKAILMSDIGEIEEVDFYYLEFLTKNK